MKPPIGFVLTTHNNPDQARFLCERLTTAFDRPPIVVHHDFGQTPLKTTDFPSNVSFVENWVQTRWGSYSIIESELLALDLLYRNHDPDWFVSLSGADYPIKSAAYILDDLYNGAFDAYLDNRKIHYSRVPIPPEGFGDQNYISPAWITLAFERYMAIGFGFYKIATRLKWKRKAIYLRSNFFIKRFTPFDGTIDCYGGDYWLTGNRKVAHALLDDTPLKRKVLPHFKRRPVPDEGFHQTMLCNVPELRISPDNRRYTDWRGCTNHPNTLTEEHFSAVVASTDHFGRKFAFKPEALRQLDELVDRETYSSRQRQR